MTITTISDVGSVEVISNQILRQDVERSEPSWNMVTSLPLDEYKPQLRVHSPADLEQQIVQLSVAKRVSVSKAITQVKNSFDFKQPGRAKIVELGKNRTSTFVVIESIAE